MEQVLFVLSLLIKGFGAYFVILSLFALLPGKRCPQAAPRTKFAVVVAARNEEAVVGNLVASLYAQEYPRELFDVYVVPNNCTDDTAGAARRAGAQVLTCVHPVRNKGDVLHETFAWLMQDESYDAFVVFDADNTAECHYLARMNDAFCAGARVAKGRGEAANLYTSWMSGCYGIYFEMFNRFYNRARANLGLSAKLVGTGFALHRDVLAKTGGWNTKTIAEDAEFAAVLAAGGERVVWVEDAVAYDEEPLTLKVSMVQRRRWISGIMQAATLHLPRLVHTRGKGLALRLDLTLFLLSPFVQALGFFVLLLNLGVRALALSFPAFLLHLALLAAAAYLGATLLAAAIALTRGGWDRRIAKSVLTYGLFMASWVPLAVFSLFCKKRTWEIIPHGNTSPATEEAASATTA